MRMFQLLIFNGPGSFIFKQAPKFSLINKNPQKYGNTLLMIKQCKPKMVQSIYLRLFCTALADKSGTLPAGLNPSGFRITNCLKKYPFAAVSGLN
jgi:hypothetical protein